MTRPAGDYSANPQDVQQVHAFQDALKVRQESPGTFEIPNWDEAQASRRYVPRFCSSGRPPISDTKRTFGAKDQLDPVRHLIGTALLWGGNSERHALYLPCGPGSQ